MGKTDRRHGKLAQSRSAASRKFGARRGVQRLAAVVSVAVVAAGISAGALASASPESDTPTNYVINGTFEVGHGGWQGGRHTQLVYAHGYESPGAVRITSTVDYPTTVTLNDQANSVQSIVAGHVYQASAWVRVEEPGQSVAMRLLQEDADWRVLGHKQTYQWRADTNWKHITTSYTAMDGSSSLDLNILGMKLSPGNSLVIDDVSLFDLSTAERSPDPDASSPRATAPGEDLTAPSEPPVVPEAPPASTDNVATPAAPAGWKLAWSDEFNGSSLDRDDWNVENNSTYGDGNQELACLMDDPQNVSVSGGLLTITARREAVPIECGTNDSRFPNGRSYTSAMLTTRGKVNFEYGKVEIRAKMPTTQGESKGLWPAFWMRPEVGGLGELDILEITGTGTSDPPSANHVTQTIHYDYTPTYPKQSHGYDLPRGSFSDGFHDFAIDWEPGSIKWYVDGALTYTRDTTTTPWLDQAFAGSFFLRLNMAVGGTWPGSPDADTAFPAQYQVDYIRVYQR